MVNDFWGHPGIGKDKILIAVDTSMNIDVKTMEMFENEVKNIMAALLHARRKELLHARFQLKEV